MEVNQIRTADDVERYIDGCLNDYEAGISTKDETLVYLAELVAHVYVKAKQMDMDKYIYSQFEPKGCESFIEKKQEPKQKKK